MSNIQNRSATVGSTLTPDTIISPVVDANALHTHQFTLSGNQVDGISSDPEETSAKKLATIFAVNKAASELHKALSALGDDISDIYLSPVLSPAITSPTFLNLNDWELGDFIIDASKAIFISRTTASAKQTTLRLNTEAFHKPGNHYLDIEIDQLPIGATITIQNEKSKVISIIKIPGRYRLEFIVDNPAITYLDFVIGMTPKGETVVFSSISVHYVKTEFESYMTYMAGKIVSGGSGFATITDVNSAISNLDKALKDYVNTAIAGNSGSMTAHILDITGNPHNITPALIRAANLIHTHNSADINGLTAALAPVAVCVKELADLTTLLQNHTGGNNPHEITPDKINAAYKNHVHVMGQIDGLDDFILALRHDLTDELATQINAFSARIASIETDLSFLGEMYKNHEDATGNVHHAIPEDFGIFQATVAEGISGTDNTLFMSPQVTRTAVESWATLPNVNITKLGPRYLGKVTLTPAQLSATFPVTLGTQYQIVLSGLKQSDIRQLHLALNGNFDTNGTNPTITTTMQQDTGTITKQQTCPGLKFMPTGVGYTTVFGNYQLNTLNGTLIGRGTGYVLNASFAPVVQSMDLINVVSAYTAPVKFTALDTITISAISIPANAAIEIDVYELVTSPDIPIIVDANPAGSIIRRIGNLPVKDYSLFDGSILNRSTFLDLWTYINTTGSVLTKTAWDALVTTNGYCESFHNGNGTTTFGLPKVTISTNKPNEYIKLKNTFLPSPAQLVTQYIWG